MDVLYFAFANDPDRPLDELKREDAEINRLLEPLAARGRFKIVRDSFATLDQVADKLTLYKQDLVLFHFSGHAGHDRLLLQGEQAYALGIAALLGACKRLQLVVLNGCATYGQVRVLHEQQTPLVIATHRPVEDPKAAAFAIQLYRSLSLLDTVEAAFEAARGRVLSMDDRLDVGRGLALRQDSPDNACWGLSQAPGREESLQWRLPSRTGGEMPANYVPNARLLDTLLPALAPYRADIARIVQDEADGLDRGILDKREAVLRALPHPISELVRYLLTPGTTGSEMEFFDTPGLPRLRQMAVVYDTLVELMTFIMLARLWDVLAEKKETLAIPDATREDIRRLLLAMPSERRGFDYLGLIRTVRLVLDDNALPYFVDELQQLRDILEEGVPFFEACRFFIDLKPRLDTLGEREAAALSATGEENLATVLGRLGFVARYTFASVKNIDVLKYRHQRDPRFRHMIVRLEQRFVGLEAAPQVIEGLLDSASVLLLKDSADGGEPAFLNLTPFVIDENAFDEKARVAKLHFFERYARGQDAYAYRHIYMPGEMPLFVSDQKNYRVLKAQFDAFAQLLFNKPMRDL